MLRRVGELTTDEAALRVAPEAVKSARPGETEAAAAASSPRELAAAWLSQLEDERRAIAIRIGGERRWAAAEDAGLFRDALGAVPPSGLPEAFTDDVPDAMERLVRRFARTHGPFETDALRERYGVDFSPVLKALETSGDLVRGELRPGGTQREWCDPEVLRRLRRASLAALRKEIEPADQRALARFLPNWQGVDRHPPAGAGPDRLREALIGLQGLALPAEVWERDVLPRRVGAYSPSWMDGLCAAGELVWIGAGPLGRRSGRVALYFREDVRLLGPPPLPKGPPEGAAHDAIRERLSGGACFFTDLLADIGGTPSEELQEALWDLVWAGEVTNDAYAPLRSPRLSAPWSQTARADRAAAVLVAAERLAAAGPGPLVARLVAVRGRPRTRPHGAARRPSCCSSATASSPASRCSPRGSPAASRPSTTSSPRWRRSASRGAATSSRAWAARSSRCRARSSACARSATTTPHPRSCSPPPTRRSPTARS